MTEKWKILLCLFVLFALLNVSLFSFVRSEEEQQETLARAGRERAAARVLPQRAAYAAHPHTRRWFSMMAFVNSTVVRLRHEALERRKKDREAGRAPAFHSIAPGALPIEFPSSAAFEECLSAPDFLHLMTNLECMAAWMLRLHLAPVEKVSKLEEVAIMGKRGAFRVHLGGRTKGYFKMCPPLKDHEDFDEDWKSELVSFHISGLIGLNRTNPVVGRTFTKSELVPVLPESHWYYLKDWCGTARSELLEGAMIGWNPHQLIPPRDGAVPALYASDEEQFRWDMENVFAVTPHSTRQEQSWAMEVAAMHVFEFLIDYEKQAHNTFQATRGVAAHDRFGPLVIVDNDRGRWDRARDFAATTVCRSCRFPAPLVERLRDVGPDRSPVQRLGSLADISLAHDPQQLVQLSPAEMAVIDDRVLQILHCVDACVAEHGSSSVLFPFMPFFSAEQ